MQKTITVLHASNIQLEKCTLALISHAGKVMLKILQFRFKSMSIENFRKYKLDLEKAEIPEIKLPTFVGSGRKQE